MKHVKIIIIALAVFGLWFTFTNFLYISAVPSLFLAPLCVLFLFFPIQHKITYYLYLYVMISIISTFIYYPSSFSNFAFYRYDGNFLISYIPLLVLPFFAFKIDTQRILMPFAVFVVVLNVVALAAKYNYHFGNFHSFFVAHNAAGGFLSLICAFLICYYLEKRTFYTGILAVTSFYILFSTHSRGSLLGLILGLVAYFFIQYRKLLMPYLLLLAIILVQLYIVYTFYNTYESIDILKIRGYLQQNYEVKSSGEANIYIRVISDWPRAINCFLESPIFGTGFGSINDFPYQFERVIPNILGYVSTQEKMFNPSHAHHSFFHILGEQGIVGLVIFLNFWFYLYRYLLTKPKSITRNFLLLSYWTVTFSALTEHRLTTPATMIPFCIIFGLYVIQNNYDQKKVAQIAS